MSSLTHTVIISPELAGTRLDKALSMQVPHLSRSRMVQLLGQSAVLLHDQAIQDASRKVKSGEMYVICEPAAEPLDLAPLAMDISIIFEDAHLLVIDKPAGLTVHPAAGNRTETLVNALLAHCGESLSGIGGVARPGIVHRIDKHTSGLLVVAKTDAAHQHLAAQLKARTLKRLYIAYVWSTPAATSGKVDAPIARNPSHRKEMAVVEGGRHAITHYTVDARYSAPAFAKRSKHLTSSVIAAKLRCELDTGRTHQIRVHMAHVGCPLLGDPVYGLSRSATLRRFNVHHDDVCPSILEPILGLNRQALHAETLRFFHPVTGEALRFSAPLPADLVALETTLVSLTQGAN